ncbi:Uu.00g106960.m01.CDS01 [Anthostomella pinea]|uniref:Uu.00g106960.m01.CDS01 n=1 Tax=Anthostomella pinea TaxID=933095 RepID=A0AAI8VE68_9PEZI|nr:Uu.00g106960.m01.CDS01 [Anthostomella pinea]
MEIPTHMTGILGSLGTDSLKQIGSQVFTIRAIFIGLAVLLLVLVRRRYSSIYRIPGPFGASLSRLWHVRQIIRVDQNLRLVEQHDKHEVSVSHPDGIKKLLLAPVPKGDWYKVFCFPDYRYIAPIAGTYAESHEGMELDKFFTYVAFDITGEMLFSKPFGFLDKGEDVCGAIAMNVGLEVYLAIFGFYRWVHWLVANPLVTWTQLVPMGHLFHTANSALSERQKNPDARFDVAAHWFRGLARAEKENSPHFNLRALQAAASSNVGAGSDTVSCGLQSFVYHMIRHPGEWQRVRDEIDAAHKLGRCGQRVVLYEDASQLPYLQACIKEALRIFCPVPMGLPRLAPKGGITIGDQFFSEGVTLTISPFWGMGYASCPGQHIARVQLTKITATVVRDYDIRQVDPKQEWTWSAYFTVVPHDWPVYISKR